MFSLKAEFDVSTVCLNYSSHSVWQRTFYYSSTVWECPEGVYWFENMFHIFKMCHGGVWGSGLFLITINHKDGVLLQTWTLECFFIVSMCSIASKSQSRLCLAVLQSHLDSCSYYLTLSYLVVVKFSLQPLNFSVVLLNQSFCFRKSRLLKSHLGFRKISLANSSNDIINITV